MRAYNFLVCGPKFTIFFSPNSGWNVVDEVLFRFLICCSVPEIFAIIVESCYKSRWILDVFYPPKFCAPLAKLVSTLSPLLWATSPKVIGAHMWNFKPNFKCSPLKFLLGPPTRFVVCASKPWPVSNACKYLRGQRPLGGEISLLKKSSWVGQHARL